VIHFACMYTCMYNSFFTMRLSLTPPFPCAIPSPKAIVPHPAGNPCPSLEPLGQAAGSVSIMLEQLPVSSATGEDLPSKGGGLEEV
jgi:hypothetical protein